MSTTVLRTLCIGPLVGGCLCSTGFIYDWIQSPANKFTFDLVVYFFWWLFFSYLLGFLPALFGGIFLYQLKFEFHFSSLKIAMYWLAFCSLFLVIPLFWIKEWSNWLREMEIWGVMVAFFTITGWICIFLDRKRLRDD